MKRGTRAVIPLRFVLVVLFAVLLVLQVFSFPGQFAHMAQENPEQAHLRWPLTALVAYWLLCVQIVVVATWRLLSFVQKDRIFTRASRVWVDVILWAILAAWAGLVAVFLIVGFTADDPGLPLLLFVLVVAIAAAGLLMVVMRALLRQATTLRSDMDLVL